MIAGRDKFEQELGRRALAFSFDEPTDRYRILTPSGESLVSITNLLRDLELDGDFGRISRFLDAVLASSLPMASDFSERLFWCLEPNDYVEKADIRRVVSDRVDRVLTHLSPDQRLLYWVTPQMLASAELSESEASNFAFRNLARELTGSKIEFTELDGVRLGFISATIPMKSSLMLAPNLREMSEAILGWPLLAVAPDRGFIYLWAARHKGFAGRVGKVVVREYRNASYPISTEVYSVTDEGVEAIGEFPRIA